MMWSDDRELARLIAERADACGGRAYYVGGCVRDGLGGIEAKDIDIEVHGISYEKLTEILGELGTVREMGASFGVLGLGGSGLDIAMPRKEKATGRGHRDFSVYTDPFIGPEKAALRRDFTINAMMQDVLTGELLDFYGGRQDLEKGIIRHVNSESFAEDPLRVLRAAQFAARFNFSVAEETVELCSGMELSALSRERVLEEMKKALLKAGKPSIFFSVLKEMNQLSFWFPEVEALIGIEQNPRFHPEGDVWNHTMKTLDAAAGLRAGAKEPFYYMLSALCHDFGKVTTTETIDGVIHAYGHETAGEVPVRAFLGRITAENALIKYTVNMVLLHMRPNMLTSLKSSDKAYMRLFDSAVEPSDLLLLAKADYFGSLGNEDYAPLEKKLREELKKYESLMRKPYVKGEDLINAGIEPGPVFKEALDYAHKLRLAGIDKKTALSQTMGYIRKHGKNMNRQESAKNENMP